MLVEAKLIRPDVENKFKSPIVVVITPSFLIFVFAIDNSFKVKFVFELIVSCFIINLYLIKH
jgi:hypothetical protein